MLDSYFKAWANALLATQVVSARLPVLYMLAIDPTPGRQHEARRMIAEKQEALLEGLAGAQRILCHSAAEMMVAEPQHFYSPKLFEAYLNALTAPAERILKANAERLNGKNGSSGQ